MLNNENVKFEYTEEQLNNLNEEVRLEQYQSLSEINEIMSKALAWGEYINYK